jgi:large subunit ribosomal protein L29
MKAAELREKSAVELTTLIEEKLKEQFNLRTQRALGQAIKSHQFNNARKVIARAKTLLTEKGE